MTEEQLLDFCKSQNWSARIERMLEITHKMKLDIKVFNESFVGFEFDRTYKYRENYIYFENHADYKPTANNRVLMWYDEQAKMLIIGTAYYRDNENFESYIKVYNVLKKDNKLHKYQIEGSQREKEIWSADNVVLTKKMFKDEIMKYLKSEYDRMNRLMQLLEILET